MTDKEKARVYDEALERARKLYNDAKANEYKSDMEDYEFIFPELAESEDKRIRKELVEAFEALDIDSSWNGIPVKSILAWLKDQKPAEWSEEDEKKIIFLERLIEHNVPDGQYGWVDGMKGGFVTKSEAISMLKSLRPQYHGDVTMTEAFKMGLEAGKASSWKPSEEDLMMLEHIIGQYETGNKNSKVMGYLPRIEELDFLKKVFAIWKS